MEHSIRVNKGDYIRKGNSFYTVVDLYNEGSPIITTSMKIDTGVINSRRIGVLDGEGAKLIMTGILTNKKPKDLDRSVDLNESVLIFVASNPFDLIREKDLVAIEFNGCAKIMEYVDDLPLFESLFGKNNKSVKAIYTYGKGKASFTAQWMSQDFDQLAGR